MFCLSLWLQGNRGREEQSGSRHEARFADGFDGDTITAEQQRANALYQVSGKGVGAVLCICFTHCGDAAHQLTASDTQTDGHRRGVNMWH